MSAKTAAVKNEAKPPLLAIENVSYGYRDGMRRLEILKKANAKFEEGTFYGIVGPSGSGKTTTLALLGALDVPQDGRVLCEGRDIRKIGLTRFRRTKVAMVFQNFNLISYMTALENVTMAMEISGSKEHSRKKRGIELLGQLGLSESEARRNVRRLSGGQQQRVAIARALGASANIILADEPTGNLDQQTAGEIINLLRDLAHNWGKCVIVVTHAPEVSQAADKIYRFGNGGLVEVVNQ